MSTGRMSWEVGSGWLPPRVSWWSKVLDTDFASDREIQEVIGPEYLMFDDMKSFGSESIFKGFHKAKDTFPRNRIP